MMRSLLLPDRSTSSPAGAIGNSPPFQRRESLKKSRPHAVGPRAAQRSAFKRMHGDRSPTDALRLIARADFNLRTNPPSKRLVLENLVMHPCDEAKPMTSEWQQEELRV